MIHRIATFREFLSKRYKGAQRTKLLLPSFNLSEQAWGDLAVEFRESASTLTTEVKYCARSPRRLAGDRRRDDGRLQRCLAFGQLMYSLSEENEEGQFGLYGTAAALELLSQDGSALAFTERPSDHLPDSAKNWAVQFLSTWNFLDLTLSELAEVEYTKLWNQSRSTLRICNVLRAVAAACKPLNSFSEIQKRIKAGCSEIGDDLQNDFGERSTHAVASTLHKRLLESRVEGATIPGLSNLAAEGVVTYRFASDAKGVPRTIREWLFVWGSIIVGIVRAYRQGILSPDQVAEICSSSDIQLIKKVLEDHETYGDATYRLFTLWALDHLNCNRYPSLSDKKRSSSSAEARIPDKLALGNDECRWLAQEIEETAQNLMRSEVGLRDVHSSYLVIFEDRDSMDKLMDVNDYFVIPVVPILLELVSRYKPSWLFRPRLSPVLTHWLESSFSRDTEQNLAVLPHQNSDYNGTVNAVYYYEAALKIADALDDVKRHSWFYVLWWYIRDELRVTPARILGSVILMISFFILWEYGASSTLIVMVVSGFLLPVIANLWTPSVRSWMRSYLPHDN